MNMNNVDTPSATQSATDSASSAAPLPRSLLGADRRLTVLAFMTFANMGWTMHAFWGFMNGASAIIPGVLFVLVVWGARRAYACDPRMVDKVLGGLSQAKST